MRRTSHRATLARDAITEYGVWPLLVALAGIFALPEFSMRGAFNRHESHYHAAGDHEGQVAAGLSPQAVLALAILVVSALFAWFWPLLFSTPQLLADSRVALLLGGFTLTSEARHALFRGLRAVLEPLEAYAMVVLFYFVIRPLAWMLPRELARTVFGAIAWLASHTTFRARDWAGVYESAYGLDPAASRALARRKMYWLIWEYATHIHGVKRPDWYLACACEQVNREAVDEVLASGSSFIVAMGHFARDESVVWAFARSTLPLGVTHLIGPVPPFRLSRPRYLYNRVHLEAMKGILGVLHGGDIDIAMVGEESASATRLIRKLKTERIALSIMVDAPWTASKHRSALVRGFAGASSAPFAVGAARIARAAGVPILLCIPEYVDESHCRLVWHDPVWVAKDGGHEADVAATNDLLDVIEQGIGRQPERYVMPIGEGRRWNGASGCWEGAKRA